MNKPSKLTIEEQVEFHAESINHPLKEGVEVLRQLIKSSSPLVGEQVKWNSLSYFIKADLKPFNAKEYKSDIVVINLVKPAYILLVFPTGSMIEDLTGLLGGNFPDTRKTIKFNSLDEIYLKADDLKLVIQQWIQKALEA
jgi:hypothetical protein